MSFSQGLQIIDLSDYIAPSEVCIIPEKVEGLKNSGPKIKIKGDDQTDYPNEKATITLNDCLACSGCITTAENVLINEQSNFEFIKQITELKATKANSLVVVSLSPQSIASLSVRFNLGDAKESQLKLKKFFRSYSVDVILITTVGRDLSLLELASDTQKKIEQSECPVITSSCPGWICYAEKHKDNKLLVPLISTVRSPQHMMGYIVKRHIGATDQYAGTNFFHVTVMPCYDKKLEASRKEFSYTVDETGTRVKEIDMVLSSLEIEALIIETGYDFSVDSDCEIHDIERRLAMMNGAGEELFYNDDVSGSGGYLDTALRHCAKEMHQMELAADLIDDERITIINSKNGDFCVLSLYSDSGRETVLLRFAYAYGFSNITKIVQKLRMKTCNFHFVEIMACPGGCLNGGGQVRAKTKNDQNVLLAKVKAVYRASVRQTPNVNPVVKALYDQLTDRSDLYTTYNIVKPIDIISPANFKW